MILRNLDLLHKYNFNNIYDIPKVNKIVITYSLNDPSNSSTDSEIDFNNEFRFLFISNFLFGVNPQIVYTVQKNSRSTKESVYNKIVIQGNKNIQHFITFLTLQSSEFTNSFHKNPSFNTNLVIQLPLSKFNDAVVFSDVFMKHTNLQNLNLFISFTFSSHSLDNRRFFLNWMQKIEQKRYQV